jgi:hypothetical protein
MKLLTLICLVALILIETRVARAADTLVIGPAPPPRMDASLFNEFTISQGIDSSVLREPPALSFNKPSRIVPFAGLRFSRGTTTDMSGTVMRGIGQQSTLQEDRVLHGMMGSTMPNELQLGIRLPF